MRLVQIIEYLSICPLLYSSHIYLAILAGRGLEGSIFKEESPKDATSKKEALKDEASNSGLAPAQERVKTRAAQDATGLQWCVLVPVAPGARHRSV